jgi:sigma-54 dependent transcriptional regulator
MNDLQAKLLVLPDAGEQVLSIRAKALVFNDAKSQAILEMIERVAPSDATVLIVGETGTGKELLARHIHERSGRKGKFVALNCGAFSEALIESELFGHEAGAFTGAKQSRAGWFEVADGGTLFLDEVGDMPLSQQVKLLRVLQERQVVRVGSCRSIPVDVRLVAATNVELEKAVLAGHFRRDLYYRLNVAPVDLPPLRKRHGDIMPLVQHFIEVYRNRLKRSPVTLSWVAQQVLLVYEWPGNIRELENVIHFAMIMCCGDVIEESDLRLPRLGCRCEDDDDTVPRFGEPADPIESLQISLRRLLTSDVGPLHERVQRELITSAFKHAGDNQVRAAQRLGISRNVLRAQLKLFGLLGSPDLA